MFRLNNVIRQHRVTGLNFMKNIYGQQNQQGREEGERGEKEEKSKGVRHYGYFLGMVPLLTVLNEKLKTVNCIFFTRKHEEGIEELVSKLQYPANLPIEDRYDCKEITEKNNKKGYLLNVFDGHGGWQVAEFCEKHLSKEFQKAMEQEDSVEKAFNSAYDNVEFKFLDIARMAYQNGFGSTGKIGACSLSCYISNRQITCANSGDSQAILVSQLPDGSFTFQKLNKKLNAMSKKEQQRLRMAHPKDTDIVRCKTKDSCYVKQVLQPTRSFGDFRLKHAEFNDPEGHGVVKGYRALKGPFHGPYITHRPDIRTFTIHDHHQFIVMASDGLWDELTPQQVTTLIQQQVTKNNTNRKGLNNKIAKGLFEMAFSNAAQQQALTTHQLMSVPQGSNRRSLHDDITILVFDLQTLIHNK